MKLKNYIIILLVAAVALSSNAKVERSSSGSSSGGSRSGSGSVGHGSVSRGSAGHSSTRTHNTRSSTHTGRKLGKNVNKNKGRLNGVTHGLRGKGNRSHRGHDHGKGFHGFGHGRDWFHGHGRNWFYGFNFFGAGVYWPTPIILSGFFADIIPSLPDYDVPDALISEIETLQGELDQQGENAIEDQELRENIHDVIKRLLQYVPDLNVQSLFQGDDGGDGNVEADDN
jgi:hypothetical protein